MSEQTSNLRFAPSPTGLLHLGNMRTALLNYMLAKASGGRFVLRLDDTDRERSTTEFSERIVEDLAWLGVTPDIVVRQSDRLELYGEHARRLMDRGLIYRCYETADQLDRQRKRLMARGRPPVYDRSALKLFADDHAANETAGLRPHYRFLLPNFVDDPNVSRRTEVTWDDLVLGPQTVDLASLSDPVLIREDGSFLYTLPSVVDDASLNISEVVRGADHVTNTGVQIALFKALGATPPRFGHHNLLLGEDGQGLSKRVGSVSIASLRDAGFEPASVVGAAVLTGTSKPVIATEADQLAQAVSLGDLSRSPARYSPDELKAANRDRLHETTYESVRNRLIDLDADLGEPFWLAVRSNLGVFSEVTDWRKIVAGEGALPELDGEDRAFLETTVGDLPEDLDGTAWASWTAALKQRGDRSGRRLFMPLRLALTGRSDGPELRDLLPLMDRAVVVRRLKG